jgi:hypothetical protein
MKPKFTERAMLRRFLVECFTLDELKDLAFDLGIPYESLPHQTVREFARELIGDSERKDGLGDLVSAALAQRPDHKLTQFFAGLIAKSGQVDLQGRPQTTSSQAESTTSVYKVSLQAWNGRYVYADGGGGGEVLANRNEIDEWATFDLIELSDNKIGLRAQNGDFVCAEGGGGREIIASRTELHEWETFRLDKLGDDRVRLRAHLGQYVSVEDDVRDAVVARRGIPHEWTIFRLIQHSKPKID